MKKRIVTLALAISTLSLMGCGSNEEAAQADVETQESSANSEGSQSSASQEASESATAIIDEAAPEAAGLDPNTEYVFGTATLSYGDFYSGDVTSTDSYDAVSSATTKKYEIFANMATDYVDETTNAEGYHITGIKNVNVAIPADQEKAYASINDSFVKSDTVPSQYKVVSVNNGEATYSATVMNVAATVTDAACELLTGSNWGDYQINILENSTSYIRSSREDENSVINSDVQGVILETKDGLKVGMEHLQSIWVMPYEISFNISADNSHNTRVSFDNLTELSKLEEKEIVSVTFINQNESYVYNFDPVYVKPFYRDLKVTGKVDPDAATITLSQIPEGLENPVVEATYIVGKGHDAVRTTICSGNLSDVTVEIDGKALKEAIANQAEEGSYTVVISSDNYANIAVEVE